MATAIKMEISTSEIIRAVKSMKKKDRDSFLEDLVASVSPEYLDLPREMLIFHRAGREYTMSPWSNEKGTENQGDAVFL